MKPQSLQERFESICRTYVKQFSDKHGLEFLYWKDGEIGGVAIFKDVGQISLNRIRYDIDEDVEKGLFWKEGKPYLNNQIGFEAHQPPVKLLACKFAT